MVLQGWGLSYVLFVHLKWDEYFVTQIHYLLNVKVGIILTQVENVLKKVAKFS